MTRHVVPILAFAALVLLTVAPAPAQLPPTKPSYANADLRIRLDSPADFPLAIRTAGFSNKLDGILCEFTPGRGKGPLVGLDGVILHHASQDPLTDYIFAREKELSSLPNVTEFKPVSSKKLDRQPGEWLQREYRVVNFNTTFRYFAVYGAEGKDRYALILYANAREDEQMLNDAAASVIAAFSAGGAPGGVGVGDGGGKPPIIVASTKPSVGTRPSSSSPTTRLFATTAATDDAKRVFASAKPTPLPAFPKIEPFRPPPTTKPATQPLGPSGGGAPRIIFTTNAPFNSTDKQPSLISSVSAEGGAVKNFFNPGPNDIQDLAASPDGQRIAFSLIYNGNREIVDVDLEGRSPRNLTNNPRSDERPVYSPDGKKIAFLSDRGGSRPELYVMAADGANPKRRDGDKGWDLRPAWSRDGKTLFFSGSIDGKDGMSAACELYSVTADGASLKPLTRLGGPQFKQAVVGDKAPLLTGEGPPSRLAVSIRPPSAADMEAHLYLINAADGSNLQPIVKGQADFNVGTNVECVGTGAGTRLYFQKSQKRSGPGGGLDYSILSCDQTGGDLKTIIPADLSPYRFHLSPDGKRLLFISLTREPNTTIHGRLYVAAADGANPHAIADSKIVTDAIWLP